MLLCLSVGQQCVHMRVCVCVCGLQGDCGGAIDSLNPILISAGGDTDEK